MINQSNQQADKQQHADGGEVQTCTHKHTSDLVEGKTSGTMSI